MQLGVCSEIDVRLCSHFLVWVVVVVVWWQLEFLSKRLQEKREIGGGCVGGGELVRVAGHRPSYDTYTYTLVRMPQQQQHTKPIIPLQQRSARIRHWARHSPAHAYVFFDSITSFCVAASPTATTASPRPSRVSSPRHGRAKKTISSVHTQLRAVEPVTASSGAAATTSPTPAKTHLYIAHA